MSEFLAQLMPVEGWFDLGPLSWPLFCPADAGCPLECVFAFRVLPFVLLQGGTFYLSAFFIQLLKEAEIFPEHTGVDKSFSSTLYVAWHVPNSLTCFPMGLLGLAGAHRLWLSGDPGLLYGTMDPRYAPLINDAAVWFVTFLVVDTILITIHGLGDKGIYIHHAVFAAVSVILMGTCACPFIAGVLIGQEVSTPALNQFYLLRGFKGLGSIWTQVMFMMFAFFFYITRVFINTAATLHFLLYVYRSLTTDTSAFEIGVSTRALLSAVLLAGVVLQLRWAAIIAGKLSGFFRGLCETRTKSKLQ